MDQLELMAVSKLLARVLRHEPELIRLKLDAKGYADVEELIAKLNAAGRKPGAAKRLRTLPLVSLELLREVVANNDKQRYSLSDDGKRIRAAQGHSVNVCLDYEAIEPPPVLYHGTALSKLESIWRDGLTSQTRHAVHLTAAVQTAFRTGQRHGKPVVLTVAAQQMHGDGFRFTCSDNSVWLVSEVPVRYLAQYTGAEPPWGRL